MLEIITPAVTGNLTVRDTVKSDLGLTVTTYDTLIDRLIFEASSLVTTYCQRTTFGKESLRETFYLTSETGGILLSRDLNLSITSMTVNGSSFTDFELDGSMLYRLDSSGFRTPWDSGSKVVVLYDSGYVLLDGIPAAIERACLDTIRSLYFSRAKDSQLKSERVQDIIERSWFAPSSGANPTGLPPEVEAKLEPFKAVWVA